MTYGVLAVLVILGGCASQGRLAGSWRLIEAQGRDATDRNVVKILNEDHFAFGRRDLQHGVFAGGGRYELDGSTYRETVAYHSLPALVGQTLEFECRLEDDLWYHQGRFQAGDEWFAISEVWRRIGDDEGVAQPRP
jgi:hypothetical protein